MADRRAPEYPPERDENACRNDFLPSEAAYLGREIEKMEGPSAKERQKEGGRKGGIKTTLAYYSNVDEAAEEAVRRRIPKLVGFFP